ncbi:MAG: hypothetical protein EOM40_09370 [Clostridia bacterium]|nr:hypothetical protein [Clostridia bacterium]NCC44895.1 hypothetical protein [Clostridia bacterium]
MPQNWMNNPQLSGIDPAKMAMLQSMMNQGQGKNQNELVTFLMAAAANSQKKGLQFTSDEMNLIVNVLKEGKSPNEVARIDKMLSLAKMMNKK